MDTHCHHSNIKATTHLSHPANLIIFISFNWNLTTTIISLTDVIKLLPEKKNCDRKNVWGNNVERVFEHYCQCRCHSSPSFYWRSKAVCFMSPPATTKRKTALMGFACFMISAAILSFALMACCRIAVIETVAAWNFQSFPFELIAFPQSLSFVVAAAVAITEWKWSERSSMPFLEIKLYVLVIPRSN